MQHPLLSRQAHRPGPSLSLLPEMDLPLARVHEGCGRARRSFAMMVGAATRGHIYWIAPNWIPDHLNPEGMHPFLDPARVTFLSPGRPEDILWCMEEILRSGAVPLVVADVPGLPGLTAVRRLHLAAESGMSEGLCQPLGLLLTPEAGGAQGVESRWLMQPTHHEDAQHWELRRLRARTAPQKRWSIAFKQGKFTQLAHRQNARETAHSA